MIQNIYALSWAAKIVVWTSIKDDIKITQNYRYLKKKIITSRICPKIMLEVRSILPQTSFLGFRLKNQPNQPKKHFAEPPCCRCPGRCSWRPRGRTLTVPTPTTHKYRHWCTCTACKHELKYKYLHDFLKKKTPVC